MNRFTITYTDDTKFSGDPLNSEWLNIDSSKFIKRFDYVLGQLAITMTGYDAYNHVIEYVAFQNKSIEKIMLMGRTNELTEVIVLDVKHNKIYKDFRDKYREYGHQILNGWQNGQLNTPQSTFRKLTGNNTV